MASRGGRRKIVVALVIAASIGLLVFSALTAENLSDALIAIVFGVLTLALGVAQFSVSRKDGKQALSPREALLERAKLDALDLAQRLPVLARRAEIPIARLGLASELARPTVSCIDEYDANHGRLAVIGAPGSGKTTTVSALTQELIARAEADAHAPIPVYIRLSHWSPGQSIEHWLADYLAERHRMDPSEVAGLLSQVVPILDGLDEVSSTRRVECAREIAAFIEDRPAAQVVLTCRITEFFESRGEALKRLRTYMLHSLPSETLVSLFKAADEDHWNDVIKTLEQGQSLLSDLLATPLIVSAVLSVWGGDDARPAALVRMLTVPEQTLDALKVHIWTLWLEKATDRDQPTQDLAVALARSASDTGAVEVALERLGDDRTRRAWFVTIGAVTGVAVALTNFPFLFYMMFGVEALQNTTKVLAVRIRKVRWIWFWFGLLLVAMCGLALGLSVIADDAPRLLQAISVPVGIVCGLLMGLARTELRAETGWLFLSRWRHDPFALLRYQTWSLLTLLLFVFGFGFLVLRGLAVGSTRGQVAVAGAVSIFVATMLGLHFVGHHWLARAWYRVRGTGGRLTNRIAGLCRSGVLRQVGPSWRFFHLELQSHLGTIHESREHYRLENIGVFELYQHALRLLEEGDLQASLVVLERIERIAPSFPLHGLKGFALAGLGEPEGAISAYERALAADPKLAGLHTLRTEALLSAGRVEDALEAADTALRLTLGDSGTHFQRGLALRRLTRGDESIASFEQAVALDPENVEAQFQLGVSLLDAGRAAESLTHLDIALSLAPGSPNVQVNRATALRECDRLDDSLVASEEAIAISPKDAEAHFQHGLTLGNLGRLDEALTSVDRARGLVPDSGSVEYQRSLLLRALGRADEALAASHIAVSRLDDNPSILFEHGVTCLAANEAAEALEAFDKVLASIGSLASLQVQRCRALRALDRLDEALGAIDEGVRADAEDVEVHFQRGIVLAELERLDESLSALDRARELLPSSPSVQYWRSRVLRALGRHDEAVAASEEMIAETPDDPVATYEHGVTLLLAGRFADALARFDEVAVVAGDAPAVHSRRNETLRSLGRPDEAVEAGRAAVAADPQDIEAHFQLAVTLATRDELDESLASLDRITNLQPDPVDRYRVLYLRTEIMLETKRAQEALEFSGQLLALAPDDPDALVLRASSLALAGDRDEAQEFFDRAATLVTNPDVVTELRDATLGSTTETAEGPTP